MKQKSTCSRLASIIGKVLAVALCLFLWGLYTSSRNPIPFRHADTLEITVFNSSCQRDSRGQVSSVRLVEDPAAAARILELCKTARPIRPLSEIAPLLGGYSTPDVRLTQENRRFVLDFRNAEEQFALCSAGQDSLNVFLTSERAETEGWQSRRQWLCTMSAEDYVNLYVLLEGCTEGVELTVAP